MAASSIQTARTLITLRDFLVNIIQPNKLVPPPLVRAPEGMLPGGGPIAASVNHYIHILAHNSILIVLHLRRYIHLLAVPVP